MPGPIDVLGPTRSTWLDDPFGLESADELRATPIWKRDFPYEAAGEDEVTRREFARYLVLGAGAMAAGNVGLAALDAAAHDQHRLARAIVALDAVPVGATYLFDYPTASDPAILLRLGRPGVVAFSQKCTHLGCVVFYESERGAVALPLPRGQLRDRVG